MKKLWEEFRASRGTARAEHVQFIKIDANRSLSSKTLSKTNFAHQGIVPYSFYATSTGTFTVIARRGCNFRAFFSNFPFNRLLPKYQLLARSITVQFATIYARRNCHSIESWTRLFLLQIGDLYQSLESRAVFINGQFHQVFAYSAPT